MTVSGCSVGCTGRRKEAARDQSAICAFARTADRRGADGSGQTAVEGKRSAALGISTEPTWAWSGGRTWDQPTADKAALCDRDGLCSAAPSVVICSTPRRAHQKLFSVAAEDWTACRNRAQKDTRSLAEVGVRSSSISTRATSWRQRLKPERSLPCRGSRRSRLSILRGATSAEGLGSTSPMARSSNRWWARRSGGPCQELAIQRAFPERRYEIAVGALQWQTATDLRHIPG